MYLYIFICLSWLTDVKTYYLDNYNCMSVFVLLWTSIVTRAPPPRRRRPPPPLRPFPQSASQNSSSSSAFSSECLAKQLLSLNSYTRIDRFLSAAGETAPFPDCIVHCLTGLARRRNLSLSRSTVTPASLLCQQTHTAIQTTFFLVSSC